MWGAGGRGGCGDATTAARALCTPCSIARLAETVAALGFAASLSAVSVSHDASGLRQGRVEANGIEFGYLAAGNGPLVLCLHGFPDSAHTWRHLLPELARNGFRAVAPFMRGYAPTALAADGCYRLGALVADAVALHEALDGDEQAVLIGSDWGAEAAYGSGAITPERWRRLVTLAVPPAALDERIFSDYEQLKRFFYLFLMKTERADDVIAANDMAFLDRLWEDWSPGYPAAEELRHVQALPSRAGQPRGGDRLLPRRGGGVAERRPAAHALSPWGSRRLHRRGPRS